jgi:hypothetical protein
MLIALCEFLPAMMRFSLTEKKLGCMPSNNTCGVALDGYFGVFTVFTFWVI